MKSEQKEQLTYDMLYEKFQFHSNILQFHSHLAKIVADKIRDEFTEDAKASGHWTEDFFN